MPLGKKNHHIIKQEKSIYIKTKATIVSEQKEIDAVAAAAILACQNLWRLCIEIAAAKIFYCVE